jgi:hypothetical protein
MIQNYQLLTQDQILWMAPLIFRTGRCIRHT